MAYDLPTAWKMDGLELSIEQKLNYLAAHVAALEAGGGVSTVSVTADYTEQTYNNKLATITVDETATKIFAPKVDVTNLLDGGSSIGTIKIGSTSKTIKMPATVMQGTEILMPERVLLGFQTALMQINSTTVKRAVAYTSSHGTGSEADMAFASEMIGEMVNGKNIFPYFELPGANVTAYPILKDTVFDDNVPVQYNLWYKLPTLTDVNTTTTMLFDIYIKLNLNINAETFSITIYGTMNTLTS